MHPLSTTIRELAGCALLLCLLLSSGCRSGRSGLDILGPADETVEAGEFVKKANDDLQKIKVLYDKNEGRREDIKKALAANDAEAVKKISDEVVYIINDGFDHGKAAVDKIAEAQAMNVNEDYREYLRLKEEALRKQMEAFEEYRQAARTLRDNYDPKDGQQREKVKNDFEARSEKYRTIMEKARDLSIQANELAKEVRQRQQ